MGGQENTSVANPFQVGFPPSSERRSFVVSAIDSESIWRKPSLLTWGFNSFGEAFFIMNFFHALQYFAPVWTVEKGNMSSLFGLARFRWGRQCALGLYLAIGFGYGLAAEVADSESNVLFCVILLVSIPHFWYDGFIWSVRRKQIS